MQIGSIRNYCDVHQVKNQQKIFFLTSRKLKVFRTKNMEFALGERKAAFHLCFWRKYLQFSFRYKIYNFHLLFCSKYLEFSYRLNNLNYHCMLLSKAYVFNIKINRICKSLKKISVKNSNIIESNAIRRALHVLHKQKKLL